MDSKEKQKETTKPTPIPPQKSIYYKQDRLAQQYYGKMYTECCWDQKEVIDQVIKANNL